MSFELTLNFDEKSRNIFDDLKSKLGVVSDAKILSKSLALLFICAGEMNPDKTILINGKTITL